MPGEGIRSDLHQLEGDRRKQSFAGSRAGIGPYRENDAWCTYSGSSWGLESGFYSKGFAKRATTAGDSVRIKYWCQHVHDLYIGTSLYLDRGEFSCSLDGDAATTLDAYLNSATAVVTRVKIRSAVPAGEHTVILTADGSGPVYFDFLEAAVPDDVPDPDTVYTDRAPLATTARTTRTSAHHIRFCGRWTRWATKVR